MNKARFVKIINRLKAADQLQNDINDLMRIARDNIEQDFMNAAGLMINHQDAVIELLEEIMEDEYDTISWWIYDTNYGKDRAEIYSGKDNRVIAKLDTPEALYDYLIECQRGEDNE